MLEYTDHESEIMSIYQFLLEAANQIPDIFLLMADTILPRMSLILNNSVTPGIVSIIQAILMKIGPADASPNSSRDPSVYRNSNKGRVPSVYRDSKGHKRTGSGGGLMSSEALSDLGFVGLLEAGSFTGSKTRKCKNAKLCLEIVGAFC
jgi:hypothetical protein